MKTFEDEIREVLAHDSSLLPEQIELTVPQYRPTRRWAPALVAASLVIMVGVGLTAVVRSITVEPDVAEQPHFELKTDSAPLPNAEQRYPSRSPRVAVSQNGRFVTYRAENEDRNSLVMWDRSASSTTVLVDDLGSDLPVFAGIGNDGMTIAYSVQTEPSAEWVTFVHRAGSVSSISSARDGALSADGRYLVVDRTDLRQLVVFDLDAGSAEPLSPEQGLRPRDPSISDDGQTVAYIADSGAAGDRTIFVTETAGSSSLRLPMSSALGAGAVVRHPSISGDGRWVAFAAQPEPTPAGSLDSARTWSVFVWDTDSGTIEYLPAVPEHLGAEPFTRDLSFVTPAEHPAVVHPQISDDGMVVSFGVATGSRLALAEGSAAPDVGYVWNRGLGEVTLISRTSGNKLAADTAPALSGDGLSLVFVPDPYFFDDRPDDYVSRPVAMDVAQAGWDLPSVEYPSGSSPVGRWIANRLASVGITPPAALYTASNSSLVISTAFMVLLFLGLVVAAVRWRRR